VKTIQVTMTVRVPCEATDEQIEEWVGFETGYNGGIKLINPLSNHDLEATTICVS